eukprot:NODE_978_length_2617_cov_0.200159.p2 type:complete len:104 gc:universal NODE_978_length_2617_cov_0.200159:2129-1818(-)
MLFFAAISISPTCALVLVLIIDLIIVIAIFNCGVMAIICSSITISLESDLPRINKFFFQCIIPLVIHILLYFFTTLGLTFKCWDSSSKLHSCCISLKLSNINP